MRTKIFLYVDGVAPKLNGWLLDENGRFCGGCSPSTFDEAVVLFGVEGAHPDGIKKQNQLRQWYKDFQIVKVDKESMKGNSEFLQAHQKMVKREREFEDHIAKEVLSMKTCLGCGCEFVPVLEAELICDECSERLEKDGSIVLNGEPQ